MSTPEDHPDESVILEAEKIARMTMNDINFEQYQALMFNIVATLSGWRAGMTAAGYSEYLIEKSAWLLLTSFYGHHLSSTEINFEPVQRNQQAPAFPVQDGRPSDGKGR